MLLATVKRVCPRRPFELWFATEGRAKWRYELDPGYKSNREHKTDPVTDVVRLVKRFPGKVWHHPSLEADDVLAAFVGLRDPKQRLVIVTGDQDLWQFVGRRNVEVWGPQAKDKQPLTSTDVAAKFGVQSPRSIPLVKALFGDTSDCVKPCAPRLPRAPIKAAIDEHGFRTPAELLEWVGQLKRGDRVRVLLEQYQDKLENNFKIVRLRTRSKRQPTFESGPQDPVRLRKLLLSWECRSLLTKIDELWDRWEPSEVAEPEKTKEKRPKKRARTPRKQVDDWNNQHPVGTKVSVSPVVTECGEKPDTFRTRTRTRATVVGGEAVVWVEGRPACYALDYVETKR